MALLCLSGCLAASSRDRLMEAVQDYNEAVRWGRQGVAAGYVGSEVRDGLGIHQGAYRGDLQIADYELVRVDLADDKTHAAVWVEVTWLLRSDGLIRQTAFEQRWEQEGGRWSLTQERRVGGVPLPKPQEPTSATSASSARARP